MSPSLKHLPLIFNAQLSATLQVSPIQALFEEKRGGMLGFITSCCAIVGGAFSVMGLVDIFLSAVLKMCFKGNVLGD